MERLGVIKRITWFGLAGFSLFSIIFLAVDSAIANWSLNPVDDLLYARIEAPLFYNAHALSILPLMFIGLAFVMKGVFTKQPIDYYPRSCFAILATGSIHELALFFVDVTIRNFKSLAGLSVSLGYGLWLSFLLLLGVGIGTTHQRRILFLQFVGFVGFYLLDLAIPTGSSLIGLMPAKDFYNPATNAREVSSWVIPVLFWLIPQKVTTRIHL